MLIDEQKPVAILVLGMHRSGTSAVTRVLNLLGAHLGSNLLQPQADNRHGFWEHVKAVEIDDYVLGALGRTWHDVREMPQQWELLPAAREAVERMQDLIQSDMTGSRLWAIKDPRMCRLAPLWIEAVESLRMRATALIVVREPYEVASSLHVRDSWSAAHAYLMWAQHLAESVRATSSVARAIISYDSFLADWRHQFKRISTLLSIDWKAESVDIAEKIDAFVSPQDRHHNASDENSELLLPRPPAFLSDTYLACKRLEKDNDWDFLHGYLRQYAILSPLFTSPLDEIMRERLEYERLAIERINYIHHLHDVVEGLVRWKGERDAYDILAARRLAEITNLSNDVHRLRRGRECEDLRRKSEEQAP